MSFVARKRTTQWWDAYRNVVRKAFHREPDSNSYWPHAADATDAVFEALSIEKFEPEGIR